MSSVDKHNEEPDVYNYLRLSEPRDRGKSHAKTDAATPESGNFSLSSSSSSLNEMNEQQEIHHAKKLTRMVKASLNRVNRPESNVTDDTGIISSAESSGVCTNSDGESSKKGTLTNSSTADLSTDSACQNVTSSDEDEQAMQAKVIKRGEKQQSNNLSSENSLSCEAATASVELPVNTSLQASNLTPLSSGLHDERVTTREEGEEKEEKEEEEKQQNKGTIHDLVKNNSNSEHAVKNGALRANVKPVEGTLEKKTVERRTVEKRTVVAGKKVAESAVKNTEFGNNAFENKAFEDKISKNGTFNFGDETFVDNPFGDETFIDKSGNKRQHQSDEAQLYKQTRDSPYSPIYQPYSRDILNTSREQKILTKQHNLHNFNRPNPNSPPKLRPQVLDPTLSSRLHKLNKINKLSQSDHNKTHHHRRLNSTEFNAKLSPKQQQIQQQQIQQQHQQNSSSQPSKYKSKPKSPHPVRRLQSFIHQKQRNKPVLIKRRSASDDEDDDNDFGEHWYNRRNSHASFNVKLAPVTSPASTTILKASPSLNAISPCASRTIYNRMHPKNREIVQPGQTDREYGSGEASIYSKAGSFFLTVASKVADNLRSTPTSPVKSDIARLGPVSEFGRQFTTNIKQSFSDMNLASYNDQRKDKQVSQHRRLKSSFKNSPTKNTTPTPDVLNTHFLNPAHAARNYKPHKNHVYDSKDSSSNVKRSHTTQDLCSFQGNTTPDNEKPGPIFEEEEELEWDDYLPDTNSGNSPLCDDISSQVSSVATNGSSQYSGQYSSQYSSQYGSSQSSNERCKIRNWGDQALTEISQMIQNDERDSVREVRESVREGAKVFDWPCHAIVDKLNVGLTIAEE